LSLIPGIEFPGIYFPTNKTNRKMSKISSELSAKQSIEIIQGIDNEDELNLFVDDAENRTSVIAASDKKYAELTASVDTNVEAEASTEESEESNNEEPATEAKPEAEESKETVTDERVTPEFLADVAEIVQNKWDSEKEFKGQNVDHTAKELKESHEAFEKSTVVDEETETIEFSEEKFEGFCNAVANQANVDQQRRGLSQPSPVDKALYDLHKELNG
tara:strand:- start:19547 stop:20200 length:654 start_codon:yes stop_codon:yes gene_type:complete